MSRIGQKRRVLVKNEPFWFILALFLSICGPFCSKCTAIVREKLIADFENGLHNNLGGLMLAHATDHCAASRSRVETRRGGVSGKAEKIVLEVQNSGGAGWWTYLTKSEGGFNLGAFEEISFYLRGDVGGEPLQIGLTDLQDRAVWLSLRRVLPGRATKRWQKVRVPLRLFDLRGINPRKVKSITFRSTRLGRTAFSIDDLVVRTPSKENTWRPSSLSAILSQHPEPGAEPTPEGWLLSRLGTQGLIDSAEDDTPNAFAYDQALGIIAFTAMSKHAEAKRVLAALEKVQNRDGSFAASYHAGTARVLGAAKYSGNNAWVVMAANYYSFKTKDHRFVKMATRCADWLLTQQDRQSGGIRGGPSVKWYSTEHNADAFSAMRGLGLLTGDKRYTATAERIRGFIMRELYVRSPDSGGQSKERHAFWTGRGDTVALSTDPQTWTVLALCPTDFPQSDLKKVMKELLSSDCRNAVDWDDSIRKIEGFGWDEFRLFPDLPGTAVRESKFPSVNVWFEGNEGVVAALKCLGLERKAYHFHKQTKRVMSRSGGIPYSTPHPDLFNRSTPELSVAATAWYIFNEKGINPFNPTP